MTQPQLPARMLVVDDDERGRRLLEGYLRAEGHEVRTAPDGPQALELAWAEPPDVVLLDVMMPGMTGYEVCARMKGDARTRLTQVMLVTALDSVPNKVEGLDTGADDFVPKPVRREEFLAKVRALLRVRRLLLELEHARSALAERNQELQLKKVLAQTLVHDLKSPLAAVLGNLDLLEMRCESRLHYLVQRSKQGATRMLKMILNLLDVEALDEGRLTPQQERVNAGEVARATLEEAEAAARLSNVRLVLDAPEDAWIGGDPVLVRRVVDNLVSNAVAHSPAGGTVQVQVRRRPEGVEIAVLDEGPGVPEEYRERVFQKYERVALREAGLTSNRGLGLTFCRMAVEAHGGTIWIETAPGGGASFRTVLPAAGELPGREVQPVGSATSAPSSG
ncbi:MAG TPA: hybrid sensor histidine kinase/response regulator [Candidatus Polarisedimenticolaceae bacterium]|nr:hybrid sensor histidine kinase/response regulator [Candidatus Polarisedimenticolaceae bacterium]